MKQEKQSDKCYVCGSKNNLRCSLINRGSISYVLCDDDRCEDALSLIVDERNTMNEIILGGLGGL